MLWQRQPLTHSQVPESSWYFLNSHLAALWGQPHSTDADHCVFTISTQRLLGGTHLTHMKDEMLSQS